MSFKNIGKREKWAKDDLKIPRKRYAKFNF